MTDLKPEDLVTRLQRLASSRRAGVERDIKNGFGDCLAGAEVTVNLMLLEQALSLLADRARMEKALQNISIGTPLAITNETKWIEYVTDLSRQALGASQ